MGRLNEATYTSPARKFYAAFASFSALRARRAAARFCMASTQVATAASPVTFTVVRIMSRMRSTPATRATPSTGRPTDCSTMASMIMPDPGTPAVPMEASTAVITMVSCWPIERSMPNTWAMKMAQTPW